ncbi:MAG: hypothetical protein LBE78_04410 [Burkholderiaceae bacterium]|jgi:hypothetical protein|nr:hypothetical protein [Burkholderiaceae bacterium]
MERNMPRSVKIWLLFAASLAVWVGASLAAFAEQGTPALCGATHDENINQLERVLERDEFRIFYTLTGKHALIDRTDRNLNGIPDEVEDLATQLTTSRDIFSKIIGLQNPLKRPRYANARKIDVFLLHFNKGTGTAYDEIHNHMVDRDGKGYCALRLNVAIGRPNSNSAPTHELFHLYQYSYSMFKTPWFLEGGARWSQSAVQADLAPEKRLLPSDQAQLDRQLLTRIYAASRIWNRLGVLLDPTGRLHLPPDIQARTYLDGTKVVQDDVLYGAALMKDLLEELDRVSLEVSQRKGWRRYQWREADQKDLSHARDVVRAILVAARRQARKAGVENAELESFLRTLELKIRNATQ